MRYQLGKLFIIVGFISVIHIHMQNEFIKMLDIVLYQYWPFLLILLGTGMMLKTKKRKGHRKSS